jgi:predicted transcriptional regulator
VKTFDDRQEFFSILNKMWDLFSSSVKIEGYEKEIEEYIELKDRASDLLAKDVK